MKQKLVLKYWRGKRDDLWKGRMCMKLKPGLAGGGEGGTARQFWPGTSAADHIRKRPEKEGQTVRPASTRSTGSVFFIGAMAQETEQVDEVVENLHHISEIEGGHVDPPQTEEPADGEQDLAALDDAILNPEDARHYPGAQNPSAEAEQEQNTNMYEQPGQEHLHPLDRLIPRFHGSDIEDQQAIAGDGGKNRKRGECDVPVEIFLDYSSPPRTPGKCSVRFIGSEELASVGETPGFDFYFTDSLHKVPYLGRRDNWFFLERFKQEYWPLEELVSTDMDGLMRNKTKMISMLAPASARTDPDSLSYQFRMLLQQAQRIFPNDVFYDDRTDATYKESMDPYMKGPDGNKDPSACARTSKCGEIYRHRIQKMAQRAAQSLPDTFIADMRHESEEVCSMLFQVLSAYAAASECYKNRGRLYLTTPHEENTHQSERAQTQITLATIGRVKKGGEGREQLLARYGTTNSEKIAEKVAAEEVEAMKELDDVLFTGGPLGAEDVGTAVAGTTEGQPLALLDVEDGRDTSCRPGRAASLKKDEDQSQNKDHSSTSLLELESFSSFASSTGSSVSLSTSSAHAMRDPRHESDSIHLSISKVTDSSSVKAMRSPEQTSDTSIAFTDELPAIDKAGRSGRGSGTNTKNDESSPNGAALSDSDAGSSGSSDSATESESEKEKMSGEKEKMSGAENNGDVELDSVVGDDTRPRPTRLVCDGAFPPVRPEEVPDDETDDEQEVVQYLVATTPAPLFEGFEWLASLGIAPVLGESEFEARADAWLSRRAATMQRRAKMKGKGRGKHGVRVPLPAGPCAEAAWERDKDVAEIESDPPTIVDLSDLDLSATLVTDELPILAYLLTTREPWNPSSEEGVGTPARADWSRSARLRYNINFKPGSKFSVPRRKLQTRCRRGRSRARADERDERDEDYLLSTWSTSSEEEDLQDPKTNERAEDDEEDLLFMDHMSTLVCLDGEYGGNTNYTLNSKNGNDNEQADVDCTRSDQDAVADAEKCQYVLEVLQKKYAQIEAECGYLEGLVANRAQDEIRAVLILADHHVHDEQAFDLPPPELGTRTSALDEVEDWWSAQLRLVDDYRRRLLEKLAATPEFRRAQAIAAEYAWCEYSVQCGVLNAQLLREWTLFRRYDEFEREVEEEFAERHAAKRKLLKLEAEVEKGDSDAGAAAAEEDTASVVPPDTSAPDVDHDAALTLPLRDMIRNTAPLLRLKGGEKERADKETDGDAGDEDDGIADSLFLGAFDPRVALDGELLWPMGQEPRKFCASAHKVV
eukprot:g16649.t1